MTEMMNGNEYSTIIDLNGHPSGVVGGMVNVITGNLVDSEIDHAGVGPNPINIKRYYNSSNKDKGTLCYGWEHNLHQEITFGKDEYDTTALVYDRGSQIVFKGENKRKIQCKLDSDLIKWGITNGTSGIHSGRLDILNRIINYKELGKEAEMLLETGERVNYKRKKNLSEGVGLYLADKLFFPNGCRFEYFYDDNHKVQSIVSKGNSGLILDEASIHYPSDFKYRLFCNIHCGKGKLIHYRFKRMSNNSNRYQLYDVIRPNAPDLRYQYADLDDKGRELMSRKCWPEGRFIQMEYYKKERVSNGIRIESSKDARSGRVSGLIAPLGDDDSSIPSHKFFYFLNKDKKSKKPIGGKTEVIDALGNKKIYHFSAEHRLCRIEEFDRSGVLYREEEMTWGGKEGTYLKARVLKDASGAIIMSRSWKYDITGNMVEEVLAGNLSGSCAETPELSAIGSLKENGCEKYVKRFTYTANNFLASEDDGRTKICYEYWPERDKVKIQYRMEGDSIVERAFFSYDSNGAMILEIIDDGSSKDIDDISDVTEKHIKKIQITTTYPIGLPEVVEEYYYDFTTQIEILLKKSVNQYSSEGYLIQQDVFDNQESLKISRSWNYDAYGNVILEVNPVGNEISRSFDQNSNLIEENCEGVRVQCEYDLSNRLIRTTEIHDDGFRAMYSHTYDLKGNRLTESDRLGNVIQYKFDAFNRMIEKVTPALHDGDGVSYPTESYGYDVLNNKTEVIDANGNITTTLFTVRGTPYKIIHPDGGVEQFTYNIDGTLAEYEDQQKRVTRCNYDYKQRKIHEEIVSPEGDLLLERSWKYDAFHLMEETDAEGVVTYYDYDQAGRLIGQRKGASEARYSYDSFGRQSETREIINERSFRKSVKIYDDLDRVIEERVESESGQLLEKTSYSFDARGNQTEVCRETDNEPSITTTIYNTRNQPVEIMKPDGFKILLRYEDRYIEKFDRKAECVDEINPLGVVKTQVMDSNGRLSMAETTSPEGMTLHKSFFQYDGVGNVILRTEDIYAEGAFLRTVSTSFEYDPMKRQTKIIEAVGSPESKCTQKVYSNTGQILKEIKPDGVYLKYSYCDLGYLTGLISSDETIDYCYSYDKNGNLLSSNDLGGNTHFTRALDDQGRVILETFNDRHTVEYSYDSLGRLIELILPDQSSIEYHYDALRLRNLDRNGPCGNYRTEYSYCLSGRVTEIDLPFQLGEISYCYDSSLRNTQTNSKYWSLTVPEGGYDEIGNLTKVEVEDFIDTYSVEYQYDYLNQLTRESGAFNHSYGFDSVNNRIQKDDIPYLNNVLNQLVQEGGDKYEYDLNGNFKSAENIEYQCSYDALGRLIYVDRGASRTEYQYDSMHRRRKKITLQKIGQEWEIIESLTFLYQGQLEIGQIQDDDTISELRILGAGNGQDVGAACAIEKSGRCLIPLHDYRGNIVTLVDGQSARVVESMRYSAYGEEQIFDEDGKAASDSVSPWRFSSKRIDPETGWTFFGRRWYDPRIGRWTTPDPLMFEDGINLYAYVKNRPLLYIDPDGRFGAPLAWTEMYKREKPVSFTQYYDYDSNVNQVFPRSNESCRFTEKGFHTPGLMLSFVNGVWNTLDGAKQNAAKVSDYAGGRQVNGVYNATHGKAQDINESVMNLRGVCTTPVMHLHQQWDEFFQINGEEAHILQLAHSQGCVHVRNALETYDPELRRQIRVLAVAPYAYIDPDSCEKVQHLVSTDFVTRIDSENMQKYEHTIKYLDPHPDANQWFDHEFQSPTYEESIKEYTDKFFKEFQ